jgi:tetratricopeptide (TPR) repeat protein
MDRAITQVETTPQRAASLPGMLVRRSEIALALGDAESALADANGALEIALNFTGADAVSARIGRARLALGRALAALGRADEARAAFSAAVEQLEPTLGNAHQDTAEARRLAAELAAAAPSIAASGQ